MTSVSSFVVMRLTSDRDPEKVTTPFSRERILRRLVLYQKSLQSTGVKTFDGGESAEFQHTFLF